MQKEIYLCFIDCVNQYNVLLHKDLFEQLGKFRNVIIRNIQREKKIACVRIKNEICTNELLKSA